MYKLQPQLQQHTKRLSFSFCFHLCNNLHLIHMIIIRQNTHTHTHTHTHTSDMSRRATSTLSSGASASKRKLQELRVTSTDPFELEKLILEAQQLGNHIKMCHNMEMSILESQSALTSMIAGMPRSSSFMGPMSRAVNDSIDLDVRKKELELRKQFANLQAKGGAPKSWR